MQRIPVRGNTFSETDPFGQMSRSVRVYNLASYIQDKLVERF